MRKVLGNKGYSRLNLNILLFFCSIFAGSYKIYSHFQYKDSIVDIQKAEIYSFLRLAKVARIAKLTQRIDLKVSGVLNLDELGESKRSLSERINQLYIYNLNLEGLTERIFKDNPDSRALRTYLVDSYKKIEAGEVLKLRKTLKENLRLFLASAISVEVNPTKYLSSTTEAEGFINKPRRGVWFVLNNTYGDFYNKLDLSNSDLYQGILDEKARIETINMIMFVGELFVFTLNVFVSFLQLLHGFRMVKLTSLYLLKIPFKYIERIIDSTEVFMRMYFPHEYKEHLRKEEPHQQAMLMSQMRLETLESANKDLPTGGLESKQEKSIQRKRESLQRTPPDDDQGEKILKKKCSSVMLSDKSVFNSGDEDNNPLDVSGFMKKPSLIEKAYHFTSNRNIAVAMHRQQQQQQQQLERSDNENSTEIFNFGQQGQTKRTNFATRRGDGSLAGGKEAEEQKELEVENQPEQKQKNLNGLVQPGRGRKMMRKKTRVLGSLFKMGSSDSTKSKKKGSRRKLMMMRKKKKKASFKHNNNSNPQSKSILDTKTTNIASINLIDPDSSITGLIQKNQTSTKFDLEADLDYDDLVEIQIELRKESIENDSKKKMMKLTFKIFFISLIFVLLSSLDLFVTRFASQDVKKILRYQRTYYLLEIHINYGFSSAYRILGGEKAQIDLDELEFMQGHLDKVLEYKGAMVKEMALKYPASFDLYLSHLRNFVLTDFCKNFFGKILNNSEKCKDNSLYESGLDTIISYYVQTLKVLIRNYRKDPDEKKRKELINSKELKFLDQISIDMIEALDYSNTEFLDAFGNYTTQLLSTLVTLMSFYIVLNVTLNLTLISIFLKQRKLERAKFSNIIHMVPYRALKELENPDGNRNQLQVDEEATEDS